MLKIIDELKSLGIAFRSLTEKFDADTPMGQFIVTMMGAVAQMQRESWMESSRIGMEKRTRTGRWNGGTVLGYELIPDESDPRGGNKLAIVPEEANLVREIFSLYSGGFGYKAIVNRLNGRGKTGKNGKPFSIETLRDILANPLYIGKVRFGGIVADGVHQPILEMETWDRVQGIFKERSKLPRRTISREYLLSGLIKCPECGKGMVPCHTKAKRADGSYRINHYYACGNYMNKGRAVCRSNSVRADEAEREVLNRLWAFLCAPDWTEKIPERIAERRVEEYRPQQEDRAKTEKRLKEITKEQKEIFMRYEMGTLDQQAFANEMRRLKTEKEECQVKLSFANEDNGQSDCNELCGEVEVVLKSFRQVLEQASPEEKRRLIRTLVASIKVDKNRRVRDVEIRLHQKQFGLQ